MGSYYEEWVKRRKENALILKDIKKIRRFDFKYNTRPEINKPFSIDIQPDIESGNERGKLIRDDTRHFTVSMIESFVNSRIDEFCEFVERRLRADNQCFAQRAKNEAELIKEDLKKELNNE